MCSLNRAPQHSGVTSITRAETVKTFAPTHMCSVWCVAEKVKRENYCLFLLFCFYFYSQTNRTWEMQIAQKLKYSLGKKQTHFSTFPWPIFFFFWNFFICLDNVSYIRKISVLLCSLFIHVSQGIVVM